MNDWINRTKTIINAWLSVGPKIWDASCTQRYPSRVSIGNNMVRSGETMQAFCADKKRCGDYEISINGYLILLNACLSENGKLPVAIMRGLYKSLLCANEFSLAFDVVSTILADLQKLTQVSTEEVFFFSRYFTELREAIKNVVDSSDYSMLLMLCKNYSGNEQYRFVKTEKDIFVEMFGIRLTIKANEGH